MVSCTAIGPHGEKTKYRFFDEGLIPLAGKDVTVYFDPHRDPVTAAIFHGSKLVCAEATCISRAPAIIRKSSACEPDFDWDPEFRARAEEAKRRERTWVRREHRSIASDGTLKGWLSEQRTLDGSATAGMERSDGRSAEAIPTPAERPSTRHVRPDPTDADLAELEAAERRARREGLLPTQFDL